MSFDTINGAAGRDLVFGGTGADLLTGGGDDDLLIAGTTAHDSNLPTLILIQTAWNSTDVYSTRISKLRAGTGVPKLAASVTVFGDASGDTLTGNSDRDWFFAAISEVADKDLNEDLDVIKPFGFQGEHRSAHTLKPDGPQNGHYRIV